jgi:uncharacterized YigZ family protein
VGYTVLAAGTDVSHQIEVKRSVFLTRVVRVEDEDAARRVVAEQRRAHHDARHHVSAFLIGAGRATRRSSDDGEPAGTAGVPTLEALAQFRPGGAGRADLSDVVAVTTRWFGGIKLGAAGLLRTYSEAASRALECATLTRRVRSQQFTCDLDLSTAGREEAVLRAAGVMVAGTTYLDDRVELRVRQLVDQDEAREDLAQRLSGLLGRRIDLLPAGCGWVDL